MKKVLVIVSALFLVWGATIILEKYNSNLDNAERERVLMWEKYYAKAEALDMLVDVLDVVVEGNRDNGVRFTSFVTEDQTPAVLRSRMRSFRNEKYARESVEYSISIALRIKFALKEMGVPIKKLEPGFQARLRDLMETEGIRTEARDELASIRATYDADVEAIEKIAWEDIPPARKTELVHMGRIKRVANK